MIVDPIYYANEYAGETVPVSVFPRYSLRAEQAILQMCGMPDVEKLMPCQMCAIKNAICAQIEYYTTNGISVANAGVTAQEYSIGKIRVSNGGNSQAKNANSGKSMICPAAVAALEQTGLLNRSVPAAGYPMYYGGGWIR